MVEMRLIDIIGTPSAISPRTGQKAYDFTAAMISQAKPISISFENITDCTSAFCNSFVGKLYMNFNPTDVDSLFHITGLEIDNVWQKKIHNAKLLGSNENVRNIRKTNIDDLILS